MELANQLMYLPHHIYGIDFSADRDEAGNKIWIAKGIIKGEKAVKQNAVCGARASREKTPL